MTDIIYCVYNVYLCTSVYGLAIVPTYLVKQLNRGLKLFGSVAVAAPALLWLWPAIHSMPCQQVFRAHCGTPLCTIQALLPLLHFVHFLTFIVFCIVCYYCHNQYLLLPLLLILSTSVVVSSVFRHSLMTCYSWRRDLTSCGIMICRVLWARSALAYQRLRAKLLYPLWRMCNISWQLFILYCQPM